MRRILALELLGGVDRLLRLQAAVIKINEIELRLPGLGAERVTRLESLVLLDGAGVVRRVHRAIALLVHDRGPARILDRFVAVARGERGQGEA